MKYHMKALIIISLFLGTGETLTLANAGVCNPFTKVCSGPHGG
ncbi:hypothetical protein RvVAR031_33680 [Agrobacterium vitis]|nr:hypothetical protein RvVAR031_33680 [Agrobacterium vitis]